MDRSFSEEENDISGIPTTGLVRDLVKAVVGGQLTSVKEQLKYLYSDVLACSKDLKLVLEGMKNTNRLINAAKFSSSPSRKAELREETLSELRTVSFFLTPDLLSNSIYFTCSRFIIQKCGRRTGRKGTSPSTRERRPPLSGSSSNFLLPLRMLLFAPEQGKKKQRAGEDCAMFMDMRGKSVKDTLHNATRLNIEGLFPPPEVEPVKPWAIMEPDMPRTERDWLQTEFEEALKTWRKRPQWVRNGFIMRKTVEWCRHTIVGDIIRDEVEFRSELSSYCLKRRIFGPAGEKVGPGEEIYREVTRKIWKHHTDFYRKGRESGRLFLAANIGWAFIKKTGAKLDIQDFPGDIRNEVYKTKNSLSGVIEPPMSESEKEKKNKEMWAGASRGYPALNIEVEYNVEVFEQEVETRNQEKVGEEKLIYRRLHLLDSAMDFTLLFFSLPSKGTVLSKTLYSLRFLFLIASNLHNVLMQATQKVTELFAQSPGTVRDEDLMACISGFGLVPREKVLKGKLFDGVILMKVEEFNALSTSVTHESEEVQLDAIPVDRIDSEDREELPIYMVTPREL